MAAKGNGTYRVGYGRPPVHSRFRKGQSGNPKGRPRGSPTIAKVLRAALDAPAPGAAGGRRRRTKREAIIAGLVDKSVEVDLRAVKLLIDVARATEAPEDEPAEADEGDDVLPGEPDYRQILIDKLGKIAAARAAKAREEAEAEERRAAGLPPKPPWQNGD
jgi:hypothetical protein